MTKRLLFILLPGVIRLLDMKLISEQKIEQIFISPPYCQTDVDPPAWFVTPDEPLIYPIFIASVWGRAPEEKFLF